jgi:hypothetical protein
MEYTLTHSEMVEGWVSFYSYYPDWMIGMNNYFYTFKGGNLYRHNSNSSRNTFYYDWWFQLGNPGNSFTPSQIQSVFNDAVLDNKLFKTVAIQGDDVWAATLITDIQDSGFVQANWYEKKEQVYFAFVRNSGTSPANPSEYALRSLGGIGRSNIVQGVFGSPMFIYFPNNISLGSIMSVGDYIYYAMPPNYNTPILAGQIVSIIQDLITPNQNYIEIDTSIPGTSPIPIQTPYFLYMKNSVAESHGVLGHYCVFTLENTNTNKVELFQFQSDIMKSYP